MWMISRWVVAGVLVIGVGLAAARAVRAQDAQAPLFTAEMLERIRETKDVAIEQEDPEAVQEMLDVVKRVLDSDAGNPEANLLAGELRLALADLGARTDLDSARDNFQQVLEIEPSNFRANFGFGKVYTLNQMWRQASYYLSVAEQVAPADQAVETKRLLAVASAGMGNLPAALEKATEAVRLDPDDMPSLRTLVEIRLTAASRDPDRHVEAAVRESELFVEQARELVRREPGVRVPLENLGKAYELLIMALRLHHGSYYVRDIRNQPTADLRPGMGPQAAMSLSRMIEALRAQALVRLTIGDHDARLLAEKAVELDPENVEHARRLASVCQRIDDQAGAVDACRRILEINPDDDGARRYLTSVGVAPTTQPAGDGDGN
jgi:tetratricopeptide (TPR) repeat protein